MKEGLPTRSLSKTFKTDDMTSCLLVTVSTDRGIGGTEMAFMSRLQKIATCGVALVATTFMTSPAGALTSSGGGYWLYSNDGGIFAYGDAPFLGRPNVRYMALPPQDVWFEPWEMSAPVVDMAIKPTGDGYWALAVAEYAVESVPDQVHAYGTAIDFGSPLEQGIQVPSELVGIASTPTGNGYWLVARNGGVYAYGDARFYGSASNINLAGEMKGIVPTPTGKGYWLWAEDGGVFAYGDAKFLGSWAGERVDAGSWGAVGFDVSPTGAGYWQLLVNGQVRNYGSARHYGDRSGATQRGEITGFTASKSGEGYLISATDGGVFTFGDAPFRGSAAQLNLLDWVRGIE